VRLAGNIRPVFENPKVIDLLLVAIWASTVRLTRYIPAGGVVITMLDIITKIPGLLAVIVVFADDSYTMIEGMVHCDVAIPVDST
jgi:hypothetical protein